MVDQTGSLRILFVTAMPPEAGVGGGVTATRSIIEALRMPAVGAVVDVFPLREKAPKLPHRVRQVIALVRSGFSRLSSKSLFDFNTAAVRRLRAIAFSRYDFVMINSGDLFFLASHIPQDMPCIGIAHNVESLLFEAQTASLRRLLLIGRFFAQDLAKLRQTEISGLGQIGRIISLSQEDAQNLKRMSPLVQTLVLPTTFSYPPYSRPSSREIERPLRLVFLGKYSWWPNVEAVEWMIGQVLAGLAPGSAELVLYGPGAERFNGRHPALRVQGFVEDLDRVWSESDIVVCPMQSGSGINVKLIEAVYNQCPVLSTFYGTRGLPKLADPAIICLDDPEDWIRFLSGNDAVDLARSRPRPATSAIFSAKSAAETLSDFLRMIRSS